MRARMRLPPKVVPVLCLCLTLLFITLTVNLWNSFNTSWMNHDAMEGFARSLTKSFLADQPEDLVQPRADLDTSNILDGCRHVYLDVGSNVGIQVRKLFEPQRYPEAYVHSVFNQAFGENRNSDQVCAVGFEPNPHHSIRLNEIEKVYNSCGWKVKFFTNSAVSNRDGITTFFTDDAKGYLEWGGGIVESNTNVVKSLANNVTLIRLATFITDVVGTRKIPAATSLKDTLPSVVMKVDIEGSEVEIFPDLTMMGALSFIDFIMIEWHDNLAKDERITQTQMARKILENLAPLSDQLKMSHKLNVVEQDDETYFGSNEPFPEC